MIDFLNANLFGINELIKKSRDTLAFIQTKELCLKLKKQFASFVLVFKASLKPTRCSTFLFSIHTVKIFLSFLKIIRLFYHLILLIRRGYDQNWQVIKGLVLGLLYVCGKNAQSEIEEN